jgi:hypothetical protein
MRDVHFSCLSRFVIAASFKKRLCSTQDIVEAINEGQENANAYCKIKKYKFFA